MVQFGPVEHVGIIYSYRLDTVFLQSMAVQTGFKLCMVVNIMCKISPGWRLLESYSECSMPCPACSRWTCCESPCAQMKVQIKNVRLLNSWSLVQARDHLVKLVHSSKKLWSFAWCKKVLRRDYTTSKLAGTSMCKISIGRRVGSEKSSACLIHLRQIFFGPKMGVYSHKIPTSLEWYELVAESHRARLTQSFLKLVAISPKGV